MSSLNQVVLIGRVGKPPESKVTNSGMVVTKFSLATSEKKDGQEETTWHNIVCFGKLAEIAAQYVEKGKQVSIVGKIKNEQYEKDGVQKNYTQIIVQQLVLLGSGGNAEGSDYAAAKPAQQQQPRQQQPKQPTIDDDDIPF